LFQKGQGVYWSSGELFDTQLDAIKGESTKYHNNNQSAKWYRQKYIIMYSQETKLKKMNDLSVWKCHTRGEDIQANSTDTVSQTPLSYAADNG
jgi:hypothetical protein